jgi:hypothetical protein
MYANQDDIKQIQTITYTKQIPGINDHMNDNPRLKVSIYAYTM